MIHLIILVILFIGGVYADYLFEGQFYSKDCQGPPTTMYIFETVNTYSYIPWTPDLNETWAPYFKFHSYAYSVEQAGTVFVELPGISCIASVRYQESQPYWSGYTQFYSSGYGLDSIPKAANGSPYCFLLSNDFNDTTILNGYNGIYLKPDNNQCYDDYYRCSLNGTFTYYTNAGCSGQSETISLGSNLATFNSTYLGNISAQFYTVEGAAVFFSWDAIVPYEDIVPYFDNAGDWVTLVFVIATLFIGTFMIYRTALNVIEKKFALPKGINLASQLSYLGYYITSIMYWTWICNSDQLSIVTTFRWIFLGLGSLLDCLLTSLLISDVLFVHQKARARIIAFPLLILVHVGLYGCSYGGVYIVNIGPPTFSNQLIAFFIQWHKISMLWMLLTFIFTSTVPILVAFKIISLQVDKHSKFEIDKVDRWLKYYIGGQIAASGLFAVTFIIQQYTYVLGNDFAALNSNMFLMFGVACHTFFTSKIYGVISASSEYVKAKLRDGPVNITQTAQSTRPMIIKNKLKAVTANISLNYVVFLCIMNCLLVMAVSADLIMEGQYFNKYCQGPPDSIYLFETVNTYSYTSWSTDLNETWPPYFKFHSYEFSVGDTGTVYVPMPGQTCLSSVRYAQSQPYWSGYSLFYSHGYGLDAVPEISNGLQYCYVISNNFNDSLALNGYKAMYLRPNDNICYDDHYQCLGNGVFRYFESLNCTGNNETFILSPELKPSISQSLGNISTQFYTIQGASLFFSWDAIVPYEYMVPYFDNVGDWIALVFVVLTLCIGIYMIFTTYILMTKSRYQFARYMNFVAQIIYMGYYLTTVIFWCWIATTQQFSIVSSFKWAFVGLGTLLDCILTSFLVSDVLLHKSKGLAWIITISSIFIIHIVMYGASYGGIYIINVGRPTFSPNLIYFMNEWNKLAVFWMLFTFMFNTIIPLAVVLKLVSFKAEKGNRRKELDKIDPNLKYYILGQICTFIWYAATFIVQQDTYILGNDFAFQNAYMYAAFGIACHTFFTCKMYGMISASSLYLKKVNSMKLNDSSLDE